MASVSSAARVRRIGFTWSIRRTYAPSWGSVRSCQRPPRSTSTVPPAPGACLCRSASSASWRTCSSSWVASRSAGRSSGFSAAKRRASTMARARSGVAKRAASASMDSSVWVACWSSCSSASGASTPSGGTPPFRSAPVVKLDSFRRGVGKALGAGQVDLAVRVRLVDLDQLQLGHLEHGQEGGHQAVPVVRAQIGEQRGEGDPLLLAQPIGDGGDAVADREPLDEDLVRDGQLPPGEHVRERLDQAVRGEVLRPEKLEVLRGERQLFARAPREQVAAELRQRGEVLAGPLVLLVLEQ